MSEIQWRAHAMLLDSHTHTCCFAPFDLIGWILKSNIFEIRHTASDSMDGSPLAQLGSTRVEFGSCLYMLFASNIGCDVYFESCALFIWHFISWSRHRSLLSIHPEMTLLVINACALQRLSPSDQPVVRTAIERTHTVARACTDTRTHRRAYTSCLSPFRVPLGICLVVAELKYSCWLLMFLVSNRLLP